MTLFYLVHREQICTHLHLVADDLEALVSARAQGERHTVVLQQEGDGSRIAAPPVGVAFVLLVADAQVVKRTCLISVFTRTNFDMALLLSLR